MSKVRHARVVTFAEPAAYVGPAEAEQVVEEVTAELRLRRDDDGIDTRTPERRRHAAHYASGLTPVRDCRICMRKDRTYTGGRLMPPDQ